jgi:tetraacyldisaccharide 4'-kinase
MNFFKNILFFPISQIFLFFTSLRNFLFESGILKSKIYKSKIISVGNLIMGGSGKTPTVEYISQYLIKEKIFFSIVSRGYKRKTQGFIIASINDNFRSIGDEPVQYFNKFKNKAKVMVCEDRNIALKYCDDNKIDHVIMDDAYQNHSFKKDVNILVSSYNRPFFNDYIFPMGMLRESRKNANRADVLIFSNCPDDMGLEERRNFITKSQVYSDKKVPVLFTKTEYLNPVKIFGLKLFKKVVIISSIAYPDKFFDFINSKYDVIKKIKFNDHYDYTDDDIHSIIESLGDDISLIMTEKDAVKICEFSNLLDPYSVYYIPIQIKFLFKNNLSEYI